MDQFFDELRTKGPILLQTMQGHRRVWTVWQNSMNWDTNCFLSRHILQWSPVTIFCFQPWKNVSSERDFVPRMNSSLEQTPILRSSTNLIVWKRSKNSWNLGRSIWNPRKFYWGKRVFFRRKRRFLRKVLWLMFITSASCLNLGKYII